MKKISIVVPCFNEELSLNAFFKELLRCLGCIKGYKFEVLFVNDGSVDSTPQIIRSLKSELVDVKLIDLSRNFGKEAALSAGIFCASGDAVVCIDADLQHPPLLILKFVQLWENGSLMVVGKRSTRADNDFFYRVLSNAFYKIINLISDVKIPPDIGDFRLIDRRLVDLINALPESRRFMKGIFAWVFSDYDVVEFTPEQRNYGISSFNKWKSWNFALEGITSFSTFPLRIWTYLGFLVVGLSFGYVMYLVLRILILGVELPGYFTLVAIITIFGGLQLIGIGILGEYIGRIFVESKRRPPYLIKKIEKQ